MNKLGIWAIVTAIAFLAGTIATGTIAYADDDKKKMTEKRIKH